MQVSVENLEGLEKRVTVELPADNYEKAVQERLQSLARTTRIAGFRPGKVPLRIVERRFGGQVRDEVMKDSVRASLYEALMQENLQPAAQPSVEILPAEEGKGPRYQATFETYPDIELVSMEGVKIEKPVAEITDDDVDRTLRTICEQRKGFVPVERASADGDQVKVDFQGSMDGEVFEGGSGEQVPVVLGEKRFIGDFEIGLLGLRAGDEKVIDATFPDDYPNKELAGKTAQFAVNVREVAEPQVPAVDEELARSLGITEGGVAALREEVRSNMARELDQVAKEVVKRQVMDALIQKHAVTIPKVLLDNEIERLMAQARGSLGAHQPGGGAAALDRGLFEEQARRRVALGLIMAEIIRTQGFVADADRVRAAVERAAAAYDKPEEVVAWYYADKQRLGEVEAMVMEEQIVEWLLEKSQLTEKKSTFNEIMRPDRAPGESA